MKFVKKYILSLDTIISLLLTFACFYFLENWIKLTLAKSLFEMGIGVLSIIFSIFFATLAFIISASDDDFVKFLEEDSLFTELVESFKWTVFVLFFSLFYSVVCFIILTFCENNDKLVYKINEWVVAIFCFLFFYSLISSFLATLDSLKYYKFRVKFIKMKKDEDK